MNVLFIDTVTEWMVVGIFLIENSRINIKFGYLGLYIDPI